MKQKITTIQLLLPFKLGIVNCYLIKTEIGFILIDTGSSNMRGELTQALDNAGCRPGNLGLIVITHGDFDHTGNAAYLREKFGTQIGMHAGDLGMTERGDMLANRKRSQLLNRMVANLTLRLMGFDELKRFTPDLYLKDGDKLSNYGLDAEIISIVGHSQGSIGILTASDDLFCGDLFENRDEPRLNSIMDDPETAQASVDKLEGYPIDTVYPGHGQPFSMRLLQVE